MKPFLLALLIGALSAFAFAPVGLWPLMPLALAALCELVWRAKSLKRSLAIGWGFGLGQFVIGTYGLSLLVMLAGGMLWLATRKQWRVAGILLAILIALHFLPWPQTVAAQARSIRVIQPNIGQEDKWQQGFAEEASRRLAALSIKSGGTRPRLTFWPEAAGSPRRPLSFLIRVRAHALAPPRGGERLFSRCPTKSFFPASFAPAATAPTSSSTRRTTPGSGAGAHPSMWRKRGCAQPRKDSP